MNAGCGRARRAGGFSLLELLLVMVLVAATGVLAAGVLGGGFARMELRGQARDIATQLRYTRARALATGTPQAFNIDPAARAWQGADGRRGQAEGVGAILFFGDGASTGGRVQLSRGSAGFDIDVAWLTGEVSLHRAEDPR